MVRHQAFTSLCPCYLPACPLSSHRQSRPTCLQSCEAVLLQAVRAFLSLHPIHLLRRTSRRRRARFGGKLVTQASSSTMAPLPLSQCCCRRLLHTHTQPTGLLTVSQAQSCTHTYTRQHPHPRTHTELQTYIGTSAAPHHMADLLQGASHHMCTHSPKRHRSCRTLAWQ